MTNLIANVNSFTYSNSSLSNSAGKLYVPVKQSSLIYSHFAHVSGIAAKNGQNGVSITKLQILNSILEHLSAIKNEPKLSVTDLTQNQIDSLIKNYQEQLKQTAKL